MKTAHSVNWEERAPEWVQRQPAQLTNDCRSAYYLAGREFFSGRGAMVDCGTLAGGTSVALLAGAEAILRKTAPRSDSLVAFDTFRCDWANPEFFAGHFGGQWRTGDSFRSIYDRAIENFREYVSVVEGDILDYKAWTGPEIEVLGVDIWKNLEIAQHCARIFFPHLATGCVVLQQDYNHVWLPHIHGIMESLSGFFERIHEPEFSGTAVFQTVRKIDLQDVEVALEKYGNRREGRILAEVAARRAKRDPTRFFVEIADTIVEAQCLGRNAGLSALDAVVRSHDNWSGSDDAARAFFVQQSLEVRTYIQKTLR